MMIFSRNLVLTLLTSFLFFTAAKANSSIDLLNYTQFNQLSDSNKNQYIKELRKIVNQLDQSHGLYGSNSTQQLDLFSQLFLKVAAAQAPPIILPVPDAPPVVKPNPPTTPPSPQTPAPPPAPKPPSQPLSNKSQCLRCIYGGFVIAGTSKCKPVKNLEGRPVLHNQGKLTFPDGVLAKDFKCGGDDIMCNPLLYGWAANNKPHCRPSVINASESCGNAVSNDKEAFLKAKSLIEKNPEAFALLKTGMEQICKNENLCKRSQNQKSKADIAKTCEAIRTNIETFKSQAGLNADQAPKIEPAKAVE